MKFLALALAGAIGAYFLPRNALEPLARVLVPGVALMATGIFPCMTLVVNAMKGEQRTPAVVDDLYGNLRKILKLLVVTFLLGVLALAAMAGTVALLFSPVLPVVPRTLACSAAFLLVLMLGRVAQVGRAFFLLLDLNRTQALLIARAKVRGDRDSQMTVVRRNAIPIDDDLEPRPMQRSS